MAERYVVRAARATDKRGVTAVCARIWADDYVPHVFDDWVKDRRGRLWVAVLADRVIAVAKLTLLGERESWLHALRVDPAHQRKGVATALLEHRLHRARRLGARVARLDTSEDNVAIHRLMRRYGFRRVERINYFHARPSASEPPRRAAAAEIDALWRLVRGRLLHEDYTARALTRADVARAVRQGTCFAEGPSGRPTAVAIAERQGRVKSMRGTRVRVRLIAGSRSATRSLLRKLRGEARRAGVERAAVAPPTEFWSAARAAGYRLRWDDAMHVFERRL